VTACPICGGPLPDSDTILVPGQNIVVRNRHAVVLTRREFRIVERLHRSAYRAVDKGDIMDAIYGTEADEPDWRVLAVLICHMRKKLGPLGIIIENVWNEGYILKFRATDC
jgi:DNA-binding response OmpR family regulator